MTEKHGHKHHGKTSKNILSAGEVLKATELKLGNSFLDAGCGDGYISLEASNIVGDNGSVYALDVYPESIETVKKEIKTRNLVNIETILADITETIPLDAEIIDVVLMANVLHGFVSEGEVEEVMNNISRVLKPGGIFAVVEFRKIEGNIGPPYDVKLSLEDVSNILLKHGFDIDGTQLVGKYHYIVNGIKKP
ncbi:MAG: class I SAM-dependent methyltransferase [Methanobacterium sp.]|uniref:class I SAM-dependent methyltransferase n=1 Tax=Methanobacterium sp. TaxID=2164 RepID=UPI003C754EE8